MKRKSKEIAKQKEQEQELDVLASEDSDLDALDIEEESEEDEQKDPYDKEKNLKEEDFSQRSVYNKDALDRLTAKLQDDFYNRLNSKKLIKKQGKVPFVEHMTVSNDTIVVLPENAAVHNDLKRELCFYNMTLQNAKKGVEMLIQSNVKIGRPNDYFAEMLKSDEHMRKIKQKVLKQEEKIKQFEEKKLRIDNKKFHRRIKAFKQELKNKDKKENSSKIEQFKQAVRDNNVEDNLDIQKFLNEKKRKKKSVIELMRQQNQQSFDSKRASKNKKKGSKKRPGKHSRKMKRRH